MAAGASRARRSASSLNAFTAMIRSDYEKYGKVIKEIGLKVDD